MESSGSAQIRDGIEQESSGRPPGDDSQAVSTIVKHLTHKVECAEMAGQDQRAVTVSECRVEIAITTSSDPYQSIVVLRCSGVVRAADRQNCENYSGTHFESLLDQFGADLGR